MRKEVPPCRIRVLQKSKSISVRLFEHPHGADLRDSIEQAGEDFQVNLIEHGWFRLGYGRREATLGPGSVFLSRPDETYRYSHPKHLEPDACLSISFSKSVFREVKQVVSSLNLVSSVTNRIAFLRLHLLDSLNNESFSLDTLACDLVDAVQNARNDRGHLYSSEQLKWYAQKIGTARELLDSRTVDKHSIWQLASTVAMSPFLFARVFCELIGVPPHQYLIRLRLHRAQQMIQQGSSVTESCYAVGFNNLSHFILMFRKHFGCSPSALKPFKKHKAHHLACLCESRQRAYIN